MVRSTLVLLLILAWAAAPLLAEEQPAAEQAAAAEIGRGLLSPKTEVRRQAEARLLERISRGGDLEAFVRAMSAGVAAWANDHERLMEVWLHQAVHGNEEVRERAVRLLAGLGAPAIRRLSLELRHHIQHGGSPRLKTEPQPESKPQQIPDLPAGPTAEPVAATPRAYDLKDLVAAGMNAVELRSLLQKAADAHEVRRFGTLFMVTADDAGHEALYARLNEMRSRTEPPADEPKVQKDGQKEDVAPGAPREPVDEPTAGDSASPEAAESAPPPTGSAAPPPGSAAPPPVSAAPAPSPAAATAADKDRPALSPGWLVRPFLLVHLPRHARMHGMWPEPASLAAQLGRARVRTGTQAQVELWSSRVRRISDARPEEQALKKPLLALGEVLHAFSGRELRYSKDVRRTKGGAWTLLTDTIRHGIALDLSLAPSAKGVRVSISATHTEVGLPIPVVTLRPAPDAAPVELERPEWSTTRSRVTFDLPPRGGGAVVSLDGLGPPDGERVLVVLSVTPAPDPRASLRVQGK